MQNRNFARIRSGLLVFCYLLVAACAPAIYVQPYDEKLVTGTEAFYKKAALMIEEGRTVSPVQRPDIADVNGPAGYTEFEGRYSALLIDTNVLLLRAMAGSAAIDTTGQQLQAKIEGLINEVIPSVCAGSSAMFGENIGSLTVQNLADLKCLVSNWAKQHRDAPSQILTRGDWSRRHISLMEMIMALQKAEIAKAS